MATNDPRQDLADALDRHATNERRVIERYRELASRMSDSAAGMLIDQILTDEEMHHLLALTMARWLRGGYGGIPPLRTCPASNRDALLQLTRELKDHERETIEECRALRSRLVGGDVEIIAALLDAMLFDSEKHERLLRAVEDMLEDVCDQG